MAGWRTRSLRLRRWRWEKRLGVFIVASAQARRMKSAGQSRAERGLSGATLAPQNQTLAEIDIRLKYTVLNLCERVNSLRDHVAELNKLA